MAYKLLVVKKKIQDDASVSQYNGLKPKVIVEAGPPERMGTWGLNSPQQFLGRLVNPIPIGGGADYAHYAGLSPTKIFDVPAPLCRK